MEGEVPGEHPRAARDARRELRLDARALHPRPGALARGARRLRAPLPRGPAAPRRVHRELVAGARHGHLRPRGGEPHRAGQALPGGLRRRGGRRAGGGGHHAPRDDAGRHRARRAPRGRALPPPRRPPRRAADRGAPAPHRRRHGRGAGVRHRRAEDHPVSRPSRLRARAAPLAGGRAGDRPRRAHDRGGGGGLRGARPLRGAGAGGGAPPGGGAAGARRRARAQRRPQPAQRRADRAAGLHAVVLQRGGDGEAGPRLGARGAPRTGARLLGEDVGALAREHPAVGGVAPAVVGAPDPGVVHRGRAHHRGARRGRGGAARRHRGSAPGPRRARHVVLLGAVAVLDPRLAGRHRRPAHLLPDRRAGHRLRHPLLLGGADGDVRPPLHRRRALPRRAPDGPRARRRRAEDVEDQGQQPRSRGPGEGVRRRRAALHARGAGQPRPRHPRGPPADGGLPRLRQQDLERHALQPLAARGGGRYACAGADRDRPGRARAPRALDPLAALGHGRGGRSPARHLPLRRGVQPALPLLLGRAVRLVHRAGQARSGRGGRRGDRRRRQRRAAARRRGAGDRAGAQPAAAASGDAAPHRGAVAAAPGP